MFTIFIITDSQATQSSLEDNEAEYCDFSHDPLAYGQMASETQSVHRFQKLAFPDLYGARGLTTHYESLIPRKFGVQRYLLFSIFSIFHLSCLYENGKSDLFS